MPTGGIYNLLSVMTWPSILGGGQRKFIFHGAQVSAKDYTAIADMMKDGKVKSVIADEYPLAEAGQAFEVLKTGRTRGKLVVKVAKE